jgi:hypothetical protein
LDCGVCGWVDQEDCGVCGWVDQEDCGVCGGDDHDRRESLSEAVAAGAADEMLLAAIVTVITSKTIREILRIIKPLQAPRFIVVK